MNELYRSMAQHPDTGPIMEMLSLVDPVDEFSKAVCLVRDCFSDNQTLRTLSRRQLKGMLASRVALVTAYETSVMQEARKYGEPTDFADACEMIPSVKFDAMRRDFRRQVDELMKRPLT